MKLCTLSTGDVAYKYYKSIVIVFDQPRKVLGTSVYNGGYHENLTGVFNHDCNPGAGMSFEMRAPTYEEHMRLVAQEIGLDPETVSGMGTAASMENVSIQSKSYESLIVTALVTGGVEVNGGRAGDPATYFQPNTKSSYQKPGTINIMLIIDADMPPGTLARALVTCTEAKTAALQELMAGSNYSNGLATGSGTDQTMIIANPNSSLYVEDAGKHDKLGELIGCVVKDAVKEALRRQADLSTEKQHSVLQRIKRFGIKEETLWQDYKTDHTDAMIKAKFLERLHVIEQNDQLVTYTSLYVHLLDQLLWELLSGEEVMDGGNEILSLAASKFGSLCPIIDKPDLASCLRAWQTLLLNIIKVGEAYGK
ncbi:MAG: adenosylcobinamide amidohydrolase [Pelosinus sp.]|jgi:adenosylcobinamide amidohydrolase|nr:adenosylcobinamide amidohydrolase [Pelosinus sp.]